MRDEKVINSVMSMETAVTVGIRESGGTGQVLMIAERKKEREEGRYAYWSVCLFDAYCKNIHDA